MYNIYVYRYNYCARSSTDRVPVFGTVDVGSIPAERTNISFKTDIAFKIMNDLY